MGIVGDKITVFNNPDYKYISAIGIVDDTNCYISMMEENGNVVFYKVNYEDNSGTYSMLIANGLPTEGKVSSIVVSPTNPGCFLGSFCKPEKYGFQNNGRR